MSRQSRPGRLFRSNCSRWFARNRRRDSRQRAVATTSVESLETRQLLAATSIAGLSDEFDDAATVSQWQRLNEVEGWNADQLNVFDVDATQTGRMVQQPHTTVWYQNWRGPMAFQNVTGDFVFTTEIHVTDRDDIGGSDGDDVPGDAQFSLAGAMIRTPRPITDPTVDWAPGSMADDGTNNGENYVFLSLGYGNGGNEFSLEVKTTRNSDSQLELTPLGPNASTATVQIARIGNSIITLYQLPGEDWQVHRRYSRPDMPATLQVGLVSYTDWGKASDFDPFTQNSTVLTPGVAGDPTPGEPFNPDLTAGFEYARYVTPDVPEALDGADLTNPGLVNDATLLSFLGANANVVDDGSGGGGGGEVDPVDPDPAAPGMALGMNLVNVTDWSHAWIFRDAFKMTRPWASRLINTTTYESPYGGTLSLDDRGWVTQLDQTVNEQGQTIQQVAQTYLFSEGGNPAGTYRAEWSGEGTITFGANVLDQGTTSDGRNFALLQVAEDQSLIITIRDTNPANYLRDIQLFMPDFNGQSLEMNNWMPGAAESPFHPLFLERLQPFDTIRFMQWQEVNQEGRDVVTAADARPVSYATQATSGGQAGVSGVSVEYMVQLVNELDANAWFNMPHTADDGYVRAYAEYVRDNIDDDAQVLVEWGNEIWNYSFGFEASRWIEDQLTLPENAGLNFFDIWAREARRDFAIWTDVFAGQEDRLVRVAAGQQSNVWLTGQLLSRMNGEFDAVSSTSYSGLETQHLGWVNDTTTEDDIIDFVLDNAVPWSLSTQGEHIELAEQYSQQLGREIDFVTYEGGSHLSAFGTPYADLVQAASDHPRMREVYEALLGGMEDMGVDMHMQYVFTGHGEPSPWGEFGVLHEMDIPLEDAHEYRALVDFIDGELTDGPTNPDPDPDPDPDPEPNPAAEPIPGLGDEFDDPTTIDQWQRINEVEGWNADQLNIFDIDATQAGRMVQQPHTTVWYQNWRGPLAFKEVTGDFVFTTEVHISDRDDVGGSDTDDVPGDGQFSLGGAMIRTPRAITDPTADWAPGSMANDGTNNGENYVFLSLGYGNGGNEFSLEVKTTRNSDSQLELTTLGQDANTATVQIARVGDSIITLYQLPGQDWQVHRRYSRPDMPDTLQVGLVSYTDWGKASDFDPFTQNSTVLTPGLGGDPTPGEPFNPDLTAAFEYARYVRPGVPGAFDGADLTSPATVSDADLLGFLGDNANLADEPTIADDEFEQVGNRTMSHGMGSIEIVLPATHSNGADLSYSIEVVGEDLAQLAEEHGLFSSGDYHRNWGGMDEAWLQGNAGWYFVLPDGTLNQWQGSFETSVLVASLDPSVHADPALLHDAEHTATTTIVDNVLTIDPVHGFIGDVSLALTKSNGTASEIELFVLTVTNQAPAISSIVAQTMSIGDESLTIPLEVSDPDGDDLQISVDVAGSAAADLMAEHNLYEVERLDNYGLNWGGQQDKWLQGDEGWYFLLPDGSVNLWGGSFAESTQLATVPAEYYDDPQLLLNATSVPVAVEVVGEQLVVTPSGQAGGIYEIIVTLDDGVDSASTGIALEVTNAAPELAIEDQTTSSGVALEIVLPTTDADGQSVEYTVELVGDQLSELDQEYDFRTDNGNVYRNWGSQNEVWVRAANDGNAWFYILPTGALHRWQGGFESSPLIADLGSEVNDDPTLLTDPAPAPVAVSIDNGTLTILPAEDFVGEVEVRVSASDGMNTVSTTFRVSVQSASGDELDLVFASLSLDSI